MNLDDIQAAWNLSFPKTRSKSAQSKYVESSLVDLKKHFHDLMRDIESLTEIDYPKMLALKVNESITQVFKYSGSFDHGPNE